MNTLIHALRFALYFTFSACVSIIIIILLTMPTSRQTYASSILPQIKPTIIKPDPILYQYIEIIAGCQYSLSVNCSAVRSGPGVSYRKVSRLRIGTVLKIDKTIINANGDSWHHVIFNEWLRYPDRVKGEWYISAKDARLFIMEGTTLLADLYIKKETNKYILVDRSDQKMYAYDGDKLFMTQPISTGLRGTPTPRGSFKVFKKTPSRYMQGPLPGVSTQEFDLPGVPWNLYFTEQGAVIHGAYWHNSFGKPWSHGCVNIDPQQAEKLYNWADLGTPVYVRD